MYTKKENHDFKYWKYSNFNENRIAETDAM